MSVRSNARLILGIFFLLVAGLDAACQTRGWTTVSPGFSSEVLLHHDHLHHDYLHHDEGMWAAGSGGSIALSVDAGQHWQKKHEDPSDGLLLTAGFVGEKFGFAAGTGKHVLTTVDGGETWTASVDVPDTVLQAAFGDALHGVIRTRAALLSTIDGKHWRHIKPANDPDWELKKPYTESMAALDASHILIRVSEGQYGDGEFLWTADGGQTWSANYIPNGAGGNSIVAAQGKFWSIGGEVVGKDKPGGGYRIPMAIVSPTGEVWEHLPVFREACHWSGCGGCTAQGCFAGRTSFVPFSRILEATPANPSPAQSEPLDRFPERVLSSQWARSGNTLCMLTQGTIRCAPLTATPTLNTQEDHAEWEDGPIPPLGPTRGSALASASIEPALPQGTRCIRCNLDRLLVTNKGKSGPVDIQITFTIGSGGRAEHLAIMGPLPKDALAKLTTVASGWLFEPGTRDGTSKPVEVSLRGRVMIMNPDSR